MSRNEGSLERQLRSEGYSQEEAYFNRVNRDLIARRREQLDRERAARRDASRAQAHWMKCPKCGASLKEQNLLGICVDVCERCSGIYLDAEEAKTLLASQSSHTFLKRLGALFKLPPEVEPGMF
jgi:Zn-finger nucleic acid-binding protein